MSEPDVSVIVPVYNTMPYLTVCLESLVGQTIGSDRLEVIAVDDGSTDGSGKELDRFARLHPGLVTVVHQPNSGGPASPCNRGVELARGRYVYFLGADDHLGEKALELLVDAADDWGSDVAFGKAVGANGRHVWQPIFAETNPDLDLYDSLLPFAISNSKLFRRSLVEEHGLRFPEDLKVGSDQPFTIEAMVRARRISVLADYTYLYVVRREDSTNISFSADPRDRLHFITRLMDFVAGLLEPGRQRDALLTRHFTWELSRLFRDFFPALDEETQRQLCADFAPVCDRYLTDRIMAALPVATRVRLELARRCEVGRLSQVIAFQSAEPSPLLATNGDQLLRALPGLGDPAWDLPDDLFLATEKGSAVRLAQGMDVKRLHWSGESLEVELTSDLRVLPGADVHPRLAMVSLPTRNASRAPRRLDDPEAGQDTPELATWPMASTGTEAGGLRLLVQVPATELLKAAPDVGELEFLGLRFRLDIGGTTYDLPLPLHRQLRLLRIRRGLRYDRLTVRGDANERATIVKRRVPFGDAVRNNRRQSRGQVR